MAVQSFFIPLGPFQNQKAGAASLVPLAAPFNLSYELSDLRRQIETSCQVKKLSPGVFVVDPKTGAYVDFNGNNSFAAASMIKVPVLVALFSAIDRGDIDPNKVLTIRQDLVAGGSGYLQYRPVGTKLPLMQVAELMIIISDNTATNMIIDLLGGKQAVNKRFVSWGLKNTVINNWLADLTGTNRTSPYDLVYLLARVEKGELMSNPWRTKMRNIMYRTKTKTLLNQGLPPGAKLAHKTGDIGSMVGDTGVVTTADGRQYIVAVQVQRPHNDRRANELIRKLSGIIYTAYVSQPKPLDSETKDKLLNPRVITTPADAVNLIQNQNQNTEADAVPQAPVNN
ncbi:MAG: serine hydrolase [Candidatus Obscuribacter sp.]|nr:serine hydrolase [Candidatus Obscuribacter sp.]MBK7838824.1 serine hydrolase [Candidatus Obscuribacter sp.]MBK9619642.1 serine hydrolase [Candidatus Obscuribacter sp.]